MSCYSTGNTGRKFCVAGTIYDRPTGFIWADRGHTNTAANFLLEATWVTDIKNQIVYPVIGEEIVKNVTDASSDMTMRTYENDTEKLVKRGKYKYIFTLEVNECLKKKLIEFDGFTEGVYFTYGEAIRGRTIDSGVNIIPQRVSMTVVDKEKLLQTSGDGGTVDVVIQLENPKDMNLYDYGREMAWEPEDLDGLTEVDLAMAVGVTQTAILLTVDVTSTCYGKTKAISGLGTENTDWTLTLAGGSFTSVSESTTIPGRYLFVTVGAANGDTVALAAPSTPRSDDVLVIGSGAVTVAGIA
jgi:hypothetical protein